MYETEGISDVRFTRVFEFKVKPMNEKYGDSASAPVQKLDRSSDTTGLIELIYIETNMKSLQCYQC